MSKPNRAQYVSQRAELLAGLFLESLEPRYSYRIAGTERAPFDLVAIFSGKNDGLRLVAIEVKATQKHLSGEFFFDVDRKWLSRFKNANVPSAFIIVDVKHNGVYWGWSSDAELRSSGDAAKKGNRCFLPVMDAAKNKTAILERLWA